MVQCPHSALFLKLKFAFILSLLKILLWLYMILWTKTPLWMLEQKASMPFIFPFLGSLPPRTLPSLFPNPIPFLPQGFGPLLPQAQNPPASQPVGTFFVIQDLTPTFLIPQLYVTGERG